jgi:hypothetical protein
MKMKEVYKIQKDGSYKYKNVKVVDYPHPTFQTMVQIEKAPARLRELIGKKYVTIEKAIIAVDVLSAETLIQKGYKQAVEEMQEMGLGLEL